MIIGFPGERCDLVFQSVCGLALLPSRMGQSVLDTIKATGEPLT